MESCKTPIIITSKEVVAPSSNHQKSTKRLPFSNLDYFYPHNAYVSVYFCYVNPKESNYADVLRDSLARTLSNFPVLAGEVVTNSSGEPESLLSDHGVDFFLATSVMELRDLDLFRPDISVRGSLVPEIQQGVLAVQVTEFKCHGLVLGITFDHRVADAYSANMFLVSWSETALGLQPASYIPIFDRSLTSRYHIRSSATSSVLGKWYIPLSRNDEGQPPEVDDNLDEQFTSRTFYVEGGTIRGLQEKARLKNGSKEGSRTKYEAFTAYIWLLLAKSATTTLKISTPVDGRTRMHTKSSQNAAFMHHYFGNVVSYPFTEATTSDLLSMTLSDAAYLIHRCKKAAATPEHFSSVVEWVEERRPMMPGVRVCGEEEAVMVSSGQRFPVEKVEFGWGKAAFWSYYFPWNAPAGYVMSMPSAARGGDWVVFMYLRKKYMDVVESEGSLVFRPLASSYLNLL